MLVLDRRADTIRHLRVGDLPAFARAGDLLVVNDTKVFPARLLGHWADTGGAVEALLLEEEAGAPGRWRALLGSGRRVRPGLRALFADGALPATVAGKSENGAASLRFEIGEPLEPLLERHGATPLPPYIHRGAGGDAAARRLDRERYQTVYARHVGAVAAPTAGLHFTDDLFARLREGGVGLARVTLHVGPGTFKPVTAGTVEEHRMDAERYAVPPETADAVRACRARGGRVIAVGSTTVRTLETVAAEHGGEVCAAEGRSALFIYPPYRFRAVDALLTNFHLPRSTLLMMVAAFAGRERVLRAYTEAVGERYAFFSYGDCMLIV